MHSDVKPSGRLGIFLPLYQRLITKKILSDAKRVICSTDNHKIPINIKYKISKSKIKVIPNGVSKIYFIDKTNFPSRDINLLYVGRLSVEKNVPTLVKAIFLVKSKVTLHIVGDGEKRGEVEKLISDKMLKNVILHGKKTGKDLVDIYKNADIFLLASDYEGLPLVLLEAMASGTPIIASDVSGIKELVGRTGILVNPQTPRKFAGAIDDLIKDKNLRKILSKRGREKAENYSWGKVAEKLEDVYGAVLNEVQ